MKFLKYYVLAIVFFCLPSCDNNQTEYTIPYARVHFKINVRSQDAILNGVFGYKTFTAARNSGEYVGYGGLLAFCYGISEDGLPLINVFDLCCPHEDDASIKITPNDIGEATCSKCGTKYDLSTGYPISGVSKQQLQRYYVGYTRPYIGEFLVSN